MTGLTDPSVCSPVIWADCFLANLVNASSLMYTTLGVTRGISPIQVLSLPALILASQVILLLSFAIPVPPISQPVLYTDAPRLRLRFAEGSSQ